MNKEEFSSRLGFFLKQTRLRKKISIDKVIEETGVENLKAIEYGANSNIEDIFNLCDFYNIDLEKTLSFVESIPSHKEEPDEEE